MLGSIFNKNNNINIEWYISSSNNYILRTLRENLRCETLVSLSEIFEASKHVGDELEIQELRRNLRKILENELVANRSFSGMFWLKISPKGTACFFVSFTRAFVVTIHGIFVVFESALLYEGDLSIINLRWIEDENLVLFDVRDIVREEEQQHYICHYVVGKDFFIWSSSSLCKSVVDDKVDDKEILGSKHTNSNSRDTWDLDDWSGW